MPGGGRPRRCGRRSRPARTRSIAASATKLTRAIFPATPFQPQELREGVRFAHERGARVLVAVNTFARAGVFEPRRRPSPTRRRPRPTRVILADIAVLDYCAAKHPNLRIHLSVQAAAATPEAIGFYAETFGVKRVVLPRVLSVEEIAALNQAIKIETEVFVFGGLCPMAEGRCALSSYATGPLAQHVRCLLAARSKWPIPRTRAARRRRSAALPSNRFQPSEPAGYPTLCKGRFVACADTSYLFEDPTSLNAAGLIASLKAAASPRSRSKAGSAARATSPRWSQRFRRAVDAIEAGGGPL